ncbi:hypothetical protein D6833_09350 [Candidatus Parcubacteria bacterium]|nr:MAG: hypothetical protein D6833_09350 [Candidatus Parcubacteria bacterium]
MAKLQPQAFVVTDDVILTAGAKQLIPPNSLGIVDVVLITSPTGEKAPVTKFDKRVMDAFYRGWVTSPPSIPRQWAQDLSDYRVYWVYPPAVEGLQASIEHISVPGNVRQNELLDIDRRFEPALLDYVLFRAFSEDAEYANDPRRAAAHYEAFMELVKNGSSN